MTPPPGNGSPPPLACTLKAAEQRSRRAWIDDLTQRLESRTQTVDGAVLRFRADTDTERQLRALVAAEAHCCPFLQFGINVDGDALALTIRGPADARPIIDDLFGGSRAE